MSHDDLDDPVHRDTHLDASTDRRRLRAVIDRMTDPVPYLIELVAADLDEGGGDEVYELASSALEILADRGDARAIPVLVREIEAEHEFWSEELQHAIDGLVAIGEPVREVGLAWLQAAEEAEEDGGDARHAWYEILSRIGIADERIFAALVRAFPGYPSFIAGCLGDYGDRRALPLLHGELGRMRVRGYLPHDRWIVEIAAAIEQLGDTLTADEERKRAAARCAREQPARFPLAD